MPSLPCSQKKHINIVRVENGTIAELAKIAHEIFEQVPIPIGSVIMFRSVSYLARVDEPCCWLVQPLARNSDLSIVPDYRQWMPRYLNTSHHWALCVAEIVLCEQPIGTQTRMGSDSGSNGEILHRCHYTVSTWLLQSHFPKDFVFSRPGLYHHLWVSQHASG